MPDDIPYLLQLKNARACLSPSVLKNECLAGDANRPGVAEQLENLVSLAGSKGRLTALGSCVHKHILPNCKTVLQE